MWRFRYSCRGSFLIKIPTIAMRLFDINIDDFKYW